MPSYSRKWRVPHDLAHAVAEVVAGALHDCVEDAHRNFPGGDPATDPCPTLGRPTRAVAWLKR